MTTLYKTEDIGKLYAARTADFMSAGSQAGLAPSTKDKIKTILLLVDMQIDFIHTDGTLSVPGALDDTRRVIDLIYRYTDSITAIAASLDSHVPVMIFFPTWWIDPRTGKHPDPYTAITYEDVKSDKWRPLIDPAWSIHYVQELEAQHKKTLMIWPYHTMIGTPGHALVPALSEAIAFHSGARSAQPMYLIKGSVPQVEHYGILHPEVFYDKNPQSSGPNTAFLNMISTYDRILVAGEAKSHCVLATMTQLVDYFTAQNQPEVIKRITFLTDCTSSVQHPAIDFDALANTELRKMEQLGVVMADSVSLSL